MLELLTRKGITKLKLAIALTKRLHAGNVSHVFWLLKCRTYFFIFDDDKVLQG